MNGVISSEQENSKEFETMQEENSGTPGQKINAGEYRTTS